MVKLFVYGALKNKKIQKEIIGRIAKRIPDTLTGYVKSKVKIGEEIFPILRASNFYDKLVRGFILDVSKEELSTIDKYETDVYKRVKIITKKEKEAFVYIINN